MTSLPYNEVRNEFLACTEITYLYLIKVALLQVSPSELTIDIKDEPEEIRSEPAPPGMD
jgi:hypothetical protein